MFCHFTYPLSFWTTNNHSLRVNKENLEPVSFWREAEKLNIGYRWKMASMKTLQEGDAAFS